MANRVFLGDRGDGLGIWVSRPGVNVLTAGMYDLLLDSSRQMITFVQSGVVTVYKDTTIQVSVSDLGYRPYLIGFVETYYQNANYNDYVYWRFISNTTVEIYYTSAYYSSASFRYAIFGVSSG